MELKKGKMSSGSFLLINTDKENCSVFFRLTCYNCQCKCNTESIIKTVHSYEESSCDSVTFNLPPHVSFNLKICAILSFFVIFGPVRQLKDKQKRTQNFSVLLVQEKKTPINQCRVLLMVSSKNNWIFQRIINLRISKPEAKHKLKCCSEILVLKYSSSLTRSAHISQRHQTFWWEVQNYFFIDLRSHAFNPLGTRLLKYSNIIVT